MHTLSLTYQQDVEKRGYSIVKNVPGREEVDALRTAVEQAIIESPDSTSVRDRGGVSAIRNVTEFVPEVLDQRRRPGIAQLVDSILRAQAMLV